MRWLRVAVSAVCVVVCCLFLALWLRSYWRVDVLQRPTATNGWQVGLYSGRFVARWGSGMRGIDRLQWTLSAPKEDAPGYYSKDVLGFSLRRHYLSMPIWFVALISGMLAVIPWLPWSIRFSLRTLLIVTTLVAVVLGCVAWAVK